MTAITPGIDIPAATTRPPAALTALLLFGALAIAAQAFLSGVILCLPAPAGAVASIGWWSLVLLHVAMVAAPIALAVWAYLSLSTEDGIAARPVAHFLRFCVYIALLTAITTSSFESSHLHEGALPTTLWLARSAIVLLLPIALFVYLRKSARVKQRYGKSFSSAVGDVQMRAVSRDGAICVLLMIASLLFVLTNAAIPSIREFGWHFLVTSDWRANPLPGTPKLDAEGNAMRDPDTGEIMMNPDQPPVFGALPVIWGTAVSSIIALVVAVPLSFGAALFLVRVAPRAIVPPISFLIEFLAAIPSIAYGIWGIFVLAPFLQRRFEPGFLWTFDHLPAASWGHLVLILAVPLAAFVVAWTFYRMAPAGLARGVVYAVWASLLAIAIASLAYGLILAYHGEPAFVGLDRLLTARFGFRPTLRWMFFDRSVDDAGQVTWRQVALTGNDMLCGGLVLAIMIIPIITAISRDVITAVPRAQIEGTTALGATWWQSCSEMLKFSRSALFGAVMLGLARAAGETMAVTMVIGNNPQIKLSPFMAAQTMSSLLASQFREASGAQKSALFEVALILLLMSLAFNIVARYLVVGKGSRTAAAH